LIELAVLCEGPTEVEFVRLVLAPHLREFTVYTKPYPLNNANFGAVSLEKLKRAQRAAIGIARSHQYVTTMIDLYGIPKDFVPHTTRSTALEKATLVEARMREAFGESDRWIPYVQLHEFEALLFVDLQELVAAFPGEIMSVAAEKLEVDSAGLEPEEINEGRDTAPSKRILRYIPRYAKAQVGPTVAARVGLERLRARCPHFSTWITALERLGR
jgi:hypothetical protein